jgi:Ca-activated chloride channel family protein
VAAGIEINALAIEEAGVAVSTFYRRWAIGPGGFVEMATGHLDYARAIRAKLLRELARPAG